METSAELECLFIISTTLTWRPLDSSRERIWPAKRANVHRKRKKKHYCASGVGVERSLSCLMSVEMALAAALNTLGAWGWSNKATISCL